MNRGAVEGNAVTKALLPERRERVSEHFIWVKPSELKGSETLKQRALHLELHGSHNNLAEVLLANSSFLKYEVREKRNAPVQVTLLDPVTLKAALWGATDM